METITFYSYKGGVGRTLALANIAFTCPDSRRRCVLSILILKRRVSTINYQNFFRDRLKIEKFSQSVLDNREWKIPALEVYYHTKNFDEIARLMNSDDSIEDFLMKENPELLMKLMETRGNEDRFEQKLINQLTTLLESRRSEPHDIFKIGKIFYKFRPHPSVFRFVLFLDIFPVPCFVKSGC